MSAACAWRFSGRSRLRASRSTSSARSRLSWVRSSFSCARRRRLRCLPRPAASSTSSRRSRGFECTISSTRPWLITECISRPRLASASTSITSTSRQRAPLRRYSPSPLRSSRRLIEISENSLPAADPAPDSTVVEQDDLDLGVAARRLPSPPAKIMSCIVCPRTASGLCSPSAQSTASVMFDLPQPFGPTITLTPGENTSRVRSGKDLKPLIVIELRCMESAARAWEGSLSGRTAVLFRRLGPASYRPRRSSASAAAACSAAFLLRPSPLPITSPSTLAATSKRRSWGGPASSGDLVGYAGALAGEQLLKRGLEVQQGLGGELDLLGEGRHGRLGGRLEAMVQVAGADHRLADRGERALARPGAPRGRSRPPGRAGAASRSISGRPSASATSTQARPLTAWPWTLVSLPMSARGKRRNRCSATASPGRRRRGRRAGRRSRRDGRPRRSG